LTCRVFYAIMKHGAGKSYKPRNQCENCVLWARIVRKDDEHPPDIPPHNAWDARQTDFAIDRDRSHTILRFFTC